MLARDEVGPRAKTVGSTEELRRDPSQQSARKQELYNYRKN